MEAWFGRIPAKAGSSGSLPLRRNGYRSEDLNRIYFLRLGHEHWLERRLWGSIRSRIAFVRSLNGATLSGGRCLEFCRTAIFRLFAPPTDSQRPNFEIGLRC